MAIDWSAAVTAVAVAMLVAVPSARAATGRIVFSGAVTEPTCSTEAGYAGDSASLDRLHGPAVRETCGRRADHPGRSYDRLVRHLNASNVGQDRLLGYFVEYSHIKGTAAPEATLIVRTYE